MIPAVELARLEQQVQEALASGDRSALCVLGYGEISLVLGWPGDNPRWACKRLPPFGSVEAVDHYADTLDQYVEELGLRGVAVVPTEVLRVPMGDDRLAVYCVQEVLPAGSMAVGLVAGDDRRAEDVLGNIVHLACNVVDDRVGLDAQLSNWAVTDGGLAYFDVTTPLLRRTGGTEALDTEIFLASLPWMLRAPVRRFVLPGLLDRYHQPRSVVRDLAANLVKEDLDDRIGLVLAAAGDRLDTPLTEDEVRADYRSDARTWAMLQEVRRADRLWQRHVRRRTYPFLLPERIER